MGLISANNGDYAFENVDEAIDIVKSKLLDKNDIWISNSLKGLYGTNM